MIALLVSFLLVLASCLPGLAGTLFFALVPFFASLNDRYDAADAFSHGWRFGVLYLGFALFWLTGVSIPAFIAAAAVLALFYAAFAALTFFFVQRWGRWGWAAAPFLWTALEGLRSLGFWGMPAGLLGYYAAPIEEIAQLASFAGVYGLSFLAVSVNVLIYLAARKRSPGRFFLIVLCAAAIAGSFVFGKKRLAEPLPAGSVKIAVAQGNLTPEKKWVPAFLAEAVSIHAELTHEAMKSGPDLVLWPETAVPGFLFHPERAAIKEKVTAAVREAGVPVLTGYQRLEIENGRKMAFNSAVLFSEAGEEKGNYDKIRLFPVMEKSPAAWMIPQLRAWGFPALYEAGREAARFEAAGTSFAVMICFESLFPDLVRRLAENNVDLLINLTNDSVALGKMSFYYDFAAGMTRLRSIETGRSLVRAANNGISLAVDPLGRELARSHWNQREVFAAEVPKARLSTPYMKGGYAFAPACLAFSAVLAALALITPKRR
ncbi:MAG TPA: apolipoprotein N-acyltransferase [Verrucomicrobiae bacterium]|nr:apolipoprotein N-acyltransferase [Verrucomicrobiae bacterium]